MFQHKLLSSSGFGSHLNYFSTQLDKRPIHIQGGYSGFNSSEGDGRMDPKGKTQKKSLDQTLTPKKSHADFVAGKSSSMG